MTRVTRTAAAPAAVAPSTGTKAATEMNGHDAWSLLQRHGRWPLVREPFCRFRYGDGFSQSRALSLNPGSSDTLLKNALAPPEDAGAGAEIALWLGLLFSLVSLTTAMGQLERGQTGFTGSFETGPSAVRNTGGRP